MSVCVRECVRKSKRSRSRRRRQGAKTRRGSQAARKRATEETGSALEPIRTLHAQVKVTATGTRSVLEREACSLQTDLAPLHHRQGSARGLPANGNLAQRRGSSATLLACCNGRVYLLLCGIARCGPCWGKDITLFRLRRRRFPRDSSLISSAGAPPRRCRTTWDF